MSDAEPDGLAGVRVAVLPAAVDVASAMQVRDGLVGLLADGVLVLIADMSATTALSIEGVHSLVLVRAAARRRGAEFRLAGLRRDVLRFMVRTGTERMFSLYDSVERARESEPPPQRPLAT